MNEPVIREGQPEPPPDPPRGHRGGKGIPGGGALMLWDPETMLELIFQTEGNLKEACRQADIDTSRVYSYRKDHPEWRERFDAAQAAGRRAYADRIEQRALEMAEDGVRETHIEHGRVVRVIVKDDPKHATRMLESLKPEIYRPTEKHEHGGTVEFAFILDEGDTVDGEAIEEAQILEIEVPDPPEGDDAA